MTSTAMPSNCSTALAYSARFSRWNGRQPGLGFTAAVSSMRDSSAVVSAAMVLASGRLAPAGGIMPARSLRIIFSTSSGCSCARIALNPASDSPPALARSLWHVAQ